MAATSRASLKPIPSYHPDARPQPPGSPSRVAPHPHTDSRSPTLNTHSSPTYPTVFTSSLSVPLRPLPPSLSNLPTTTCHASILSALSSQQNHVNTERREQTFLVEGYADHLGGAGLPANVDQPRHADAPVDVTDDELWFSVPVSPDRDFEL